jgi:hypothetical protein
VTNPIYAGAYAFGRTGSRVSIETGRKKVVRGFKKERKDWEVLIPNHHEGYLSWADYERNLSLIADNANGKNPMSRGALRRGEALLAGLLRCGHCGRKLHVAYSGKDGNTGRYHCQGGFINHGGDRCISFGGMRIDRDVAAEVIERLQPLGIESALAAQAARSRASEDKRRQVELALEQARYEVGRARRQYDVVDPDKKGWAALLINFLNGIAGWRHHSHVRNNPRATTHGPCFFAGSPATKKPSAAPFHQEDRPQPFLRPQAAAVRDGFLRNGDAGCRRYGLERKAENLCAPMQIVDDPGPIAGLVEGCARVDVVHPVTNGVVEQDGNFARRGGDRLGFADARREPPIECA